MLGFAHRGASKHYPENTLLAFEKALELGAKGIELDVQLSKDGYLIILHDESVERTFEGSGLVQKMTLKELQSLVPRYTEFRQHPKCRICVLEDVLELLKHDASVCLNIELKTDRVDYTGIEAKVIQAVEAYNLSTQVILSSFNQDTIKRCKAIAPHIRVGALQHEKDLSVLNKAIANKFEAIHPYVGWVDEELIAACHKHGIIVNTYTVNEAERINVLAQDGIDGIFTDDIGLFHEIVSEYNA